MNGNLSNTTPAPATGGVNVLWQDDGAGNGSAYVPAATTSTPGVAINPMTTLGDLIDGGASGTPQRLGIGSSGQVLTVVSGAPVWATPASSGGGSDVGKNLIVLPQFTLGDSGFVGTTLILTIHASQVVGLGSSLKLRFDVGAGAAVSLNSAVVRRTAPNSITWLDSTPITWGGSGTPTFSVSTQNFSDAVTVAIDTNHDYYFLVYVGASAGATFPKLSGAPTSFGLFSSGYAGGDQTATADASTLASPSAELVSLAQVVIAS